MPELAEVEHARRAWNVGLGRRLLGVEVSPSAGRVVREVDVACVVRTLRGQIFRASLARGKQLLFRFGKDRWLGLHLGMAGSLAARPPDHLPGKHDLLVLRQRARALVFTDLRHFGRVRLHLGPEPPPYWTALPPDVLSSDFTFPRFEAFCLRRARSPVKTVLLDQRLFPGVGNWMADEILWRARVSPARNAGDLDVRARHALFRTVRWVCRAAVAVIDEAWEYPPHWLFRHRWEDGERCPRCGRGLSRVVIGGRRTCFCPRCQPPPTRA